MLTQRQRSFPCLLPLSVLSPSSRLRYCFRHLRNTATPETRSRKGERKREERDESLKLEPLKFSEQLYSSLFYYLFFQIWGGPTEFSVKLLMSAFAALCCNSPLGQAVLSNGQLLLKVGTRAVPWSKIVPQSMQRSWVCWMGSWGTQILPAWMTAAFCSDCSN